MSPQNRNTLHVGTAGSGKTTAALKELIEKAELDYAVVAVDPHRDSLARSALEHLVARGHEHRIIYDDLDALDRVPAYRFLRPSRAESSLVRSIENEEQARAYADVVCSKRHLNLAGAAQTEEWVIGSFNLYLGQPDPLPPVTDIRYAFQPQHRKFAELVSRCTDRDTAAKFAALAQARSLAAVGPARRLLESIMSPAFCVRAGSVRPTFDLGKHLDRRGIFLIEGGHTVSADTQRVILATIVIQTIHYVRHRRRSWPLVALFIDEATNWGLVDDQHVGRALAECRKKGLGDIHIMVQTLNFPSSALQDNVLTNTARHCWYFNSNASTARVAAADLGQPDLADRIRQLFAGQRYVRHGSKVFFEQVNPPEDLWTFDGLGRLRADQALRRIKQRPEYYSPEDQTAAESGETAASTGDSETKPSSSCSASTPAPSVKLSPSSSSPAQRLRRIAESRSSESEA